MNTIAILPESGEEHPTTFRALAKEHKATGRTPGEALDALTAQLGTEKAGAAVVVQRFTPDRHFSVEQRERLSRLMARWRSARGVGDSLPLAEQADLERLVDEEIEGTAERAAQMGRDLKATQELRRSYEEKETELELRYEKERRRASKLHTASGVVSIFTMLLNVAVCVALLLLGREILTSGITGVVAAVALMGTIVTTSLINLLLYWLSDAADERLNRHRRLVEECRRLAELEALLDSIERSGEGGKLRKLTMAR